MNYTEEDIRDHFEGLGLSDRYYDTYKDFVINRVQEENRYGSDLSIENILEDCDKYIELYSSQIDLGHSHEWADAYAEETWLDDNPESVVIEAYNAIQEFNQEREPHIHTQTISNEPIFFDTYKEIIKDGDSDAKKKALKAVQIYTNKIDRNHNKDYARDFVCYLAFEDGDTYYANIHDKAYSIAKENGCNLNDASEFADE